MNVQNGYADVIRHNPLLLGLFICTLISPVMPGVWLFAIAVVAVWKYRFQLLEKDLAAWTLLGLAGVSVVATMIQQTVFGLASILFFFIYFALYGWMKREVSVAQLDKGLTATGIAGVGIVAVMLIDKWGGFDFLSDTVSYFFGLESWKPTRSHRSTGTSGNANLAASLLVCLALICFYKLIRPGVRFRFRLFWASLFVSYAWGFDALTRTRMGWAALGLGVVVQLWTLYGERWKLKVKHVHFSLAVLAVALAGLIGTFGKEIMPRAGSFHEDLLLRLEIWHRALHIFQDNWLFGVLPLHFGEVFKSQYGVYEFHAHNLFIGVAVDFGIIGFTLFMLLLGSAVIRGVQWIAWARDERDKGLAITLLSLIFGFVGQGLADYTVLVPQTGWLFFMSLGFIHIRWTQLAATRHSDFVKKKMVHQSHRPQTMHLISK